VQQISERIYTVEGLLVGRVYVIEGQDGLTLIDTSLPNVRGKIEQQLQTIGHSLSEIKRILITHAHPDHIGSLTDLQKATDAQIYIHHRDAGVLRGELPPPRPSAEKLQGIARLLAPIMPAGSIKEPARVDCELKDGDVLNEVWPGLCVIDLPGHSAGQVGFWLPDQRLLFCGDMLMRMMGKLRLPIAVVTPDMAEAKRSIKKATTMDIDILCLGHGKPIIGGASSAIRAFAATM
jgi:glyoxylase-like metal-dependent hydrolase (beta-lactamase superfamily II)